MDGIAFRCMYENSVGGIIFSGMVKDHLSGTSVEFKCTAGVEIPKTEYREAQTKQRPLENDRELDYFFLSSYTPPMIHVLMQEIKRRRVHTVILPYVTPVARLQILSDYESGHVGMQKKRALGRQTEGSGVSVRIADEVAEFLKSPDAVLQKLGVKKRYFLYQNGKDLPRDYAGMDQAITSMEEGEYFEEPSAELCAYVESMEGQSINLKKAGYIKKANWLFYPGVYGPDIRNADRSLYTHTTMVLYTGPVDTDCSKIVAKVHESSINMETRCRNQDLDSSVTGCVKCLYDSEYVTFRSINKDPVPHEVFGHFLLGTYNLNRHLGEMLNRFSGIREMIRINAIPNCGSKESWNRCFPSLFPGNYSKFWFLNIMPYTDSQVMLDIAKTSPRNRFLLGTDQISYCISGRILKKDADNSFL